jgi:hypothetical protein
VIRPPDERAPMSPQTVHWIANEIRHRRAELSLMEEWLQKEVASFSDRQQGFLRINFWRHVLKVAEEDIIRGHW